MAPAARGFAGLVERIAAAWRRLAPRPDAGRERPFVAPGGWCGGTSTCRFNRSAPAAPSRDRADVRRDGA